MICLLPHHRPRSCFDRRSEISVAVPAQQGSFQQNRRKADARLRQALLVRASDFRAVRQVSTERPDALRLMSLFIVSMNARYFGSYMSRVSIHAAANPDEPIPARRLAL